MFTFAIAYLSLPVFIVLFTFFSMPFVLLSAAALVVLIFCIHNSWQSKQNKAFCWQSLIKHWPLLLVALVVTFPCIVYPIKVWDWEKHYAVFDFLIRTTWPPVLELNEQPHFLRYWIAWYIVPALLAKIFGAHLLTFFMYVWTTIGIFIALFLAFRYLQKPRHLFVAALVFFFFSGVDAAMLLFYPGYSEPLSTHWFQWWTAWGHIGSNLFNIVWIPQHLIGASVGACLFLYNRRLALQYSGLIAAIVFFMVTLLCLRAFAAWYLGTC